MSMWLEEPDAEASDSLGAGLGLPHLPTVTEGVEGSDEVDALVDEGEDWTPAQGYPDSSQSVRIWVDDEHRLTKVVISNKWRDRAKGTSLSSMFDEAFLLATAQLGDGDAIAMPQDLDTEPEPQSGEPLSWDGVLEALRRVDEFNAAVAELEAKPEEEVVPSRWVGAEAVGSSQNRMVQVTLDIHGHTRQVQFNEGWLLQSRVSEVCDAVMQAHQQAYADYQPPTYEQGDRMRLAIEGHRLTQQTMSLMRQGGTQ